MFNIPPVYSCATLMPEREKTSARRKCDELNELKIQNLKQKKRNNFIPSKLYPRAGVHHIQTPGHTMLTVFPKCWISVIESARHDNGTGRKSTFPELVLPFVPCCVLPSISGNVIVFRAYSAQITADLKPRSTVIAEKANRCNFRAGEQRSTHISRFIRQSTEMMLFTIDTSKDLRRLATLKTHHFLSHSYSRLQSSPGFNGPSSTQATAWVKHADSISQNCSPLSSARLPPQNVQIVYAELVDTYRSAWGWLSWWWLHPHASAAKHEAAGCKNYTLCSD